MESEESRKAKRAKICSDSSLKILRRGFGERLLTKRSDAVAAQRGAALNSADKVRYYFGSDRAEAGDFRCESGGYRILSSDATASGGEAGRDRARGKGDQKAVRENREKNGCASQCQ